MKRVLKWIGGGLGLACGGTAAAATYKYNTDPGIKRTMQFAWAVTPMSFAYGSAASKEYETKDKKTAAMDELHRIYAPELLRIILEMKGYYIKAAQMVCGIGMLPDAYEDELKCLLDDVPPRDTALIKSIIEEEFDCPIDDLFESFSDKSIGAASIGQAHLATLKGSGHEVVVKVQYPEVEGFFHIDLFTVQALCSLFMEGSDKLFEEFGKSFESEFDYRLEVSNLRVCSKNLIKAGFADKVRD